MYKQILLIAAVFIAIAASQTSSPCQSYTSYSYGYTTTAFNFLRKDYVFSFAEFGQISTDVTNQIQSVQFTIAFNNSDNIPIFENGQTIYFAENATNYIISNGYCFTENNVDFPIPNTFVPPQLMYTGQINIGSSAFNLYQSKNFDGQHQLAGVFEPETCIPIGMDLVNIDDVYGTAKVDVFEFSTQIYDSAFQLPSVCFDSSTLLKKSSYRGVRSMNPMSILNGDI
ncbi:hypothetical protein DLAC_01059 [Tieghemostelium lacteum]|uniref:Uncharacterized protein n=1 Tax=Tieghemostelium lacteum TaxID=361077 RepID=A0A152A7Y6_TIELA|nr:hypothetical protein DLAC_01059 [Tieghemostelium lacteum]|eukprot:KYR02235.1 hypothetical protein DLAC_01059 [Tieghemostelium lacteum]